MIEADAKVIAIKETDYCYVLACAWEGEVNNSVCLERIFTKNGCEEIRMAWWKDGRQTMRPADLDAVDWVPLFSKAIQQGIFTADERLGMLKAILS